MSRERFPDNTPYRLPNRDIRLTEKAQGYQIGMQSNGHIQDQQGIWKFNGEAMSDPLQRYNHQKVSFFGPMGGRHDYFSPGTTRPEWFIPSFKQPLVADALHKMDLANPELSAGIAYLMGGLVRYEVREVKSQMAVENAAEKVAYATQMMKLAGEESTEAVASVAAMYLLSGGSVERNKEFDKNIYYMAESVADDPVTISQTQDLGLSQVARIRSFLGKLSDKEEDFPDIQGELASFDGFPTVGAEFHFTPKQAAKIPHLWERLAILNLSQYHTESAIQLSGNDNEVIEVRMNPSVYPVTIANWNHMRLLLPELNHATFTITLNRTDSKGDFDWKDREDSRVLKTLHGLALLNHVRYYEEEPSGAEPGEISFGSSYVGQTITVQDGEYAYTGLWNGGRGKDGQLGVYAGIGDNLPDMAYYLSHTLHALSLGDSAVSETLRGVYTLHDAYQLKESNRKDTFQAIDKHIAEDKEQSLVHSSGNQIMAKLNP